MPTYRTPDVYIEEIPVFPPSVAEVETAIPAFFGYTERAPEAAAGAPPAVVKLRDFAEYERLFGGPPVADIAITLAGTPEAMRATVDADQPAHLMYHAVKMFFDNGGGKCYIVSVGTHADAVALDDLQGALAEIELVDEPTLLVCPDAVRLGANDHATLSQAMLRQCGELKDRFAILDVRAGDRALDDAALAAARAAVGNESLKYGALYYPFVRSAFTHAFAADGSNVTVTADAATAAAAGVAAAGRAAVAGGVRLGALNNPAANTHSTALYNAALAAVRDHHVVMPPSGAVAGAYATVDTTRGVWKAPANVGLADVIGPVVALGTPQQDELNVDATTGKSINAIRAFSGRGTLVWGARTLAGNDNEWRYISVRRFFNMVEESIKKSTYWAVFEPNDANTWVKVRGMIENYLTQKWREGALAGATTKDAFFVRCGLGVTMTQQDVLEGRLNVEIGMAVVRPAEFVVLKFMHKLQTS